MRDYQVETMNNYYFFDYNKPINPIKNDMRTSYNRGHQNFLVTSNIGPPAKTVENPCKILSNKEMCYDYMTEHSDQYRRRTIYPSTSRADPAMLLNRPQFIKTMHEHMMCRPPKPIKQFSSYHLDYGPKSVNSGIKILPNNSTCAHPAKPSVSIYTTHPGHYKFLDPLATTNMLDYPPWTVEQQNGIGRKDNITVWDWLEYPKARGFGLEFYPVKQKGVKVPMVDHIPFKLIARDRIIPESKNPVPHYGNNTEKRARYSWPVPMNFEPNIYDVLPVSIPPILKTGTTEYTMYGSTERSNKLLDQGAVTID